MLHHIGKILTTLIVLIFLGTLQLAATYEDGLSAYNRGDYAKAATMLRKAAEEGYAAAQNNLGVINETGKGVPQDYTNAVTWYRQAAEQGHGHGQALLVLIYLNGKGVYHRILQEPWIGFVRLPDEACQTLRVSSGWDILWARAHHRITWRHTSGCTLPRLRET
jgi:TPR repeat protein